MQLKMFSQLKLIFFWQSDIAQWKLFCQNRENYPQLWVVCIKRVSVVETDCISFQNTVLKK